MALMTENGKIIPSQKVCTMGIVKPNIEELMPIESQLKKDSNSESKVLTKMMIKAPADDLESIVSSILDVHGSDELIMTLMLEKP